MYIHFVCDFEVSERVDKLVLSLIVKLHTQYAQSAPATRMIKYVTFCLHILITKTVFGDKIRPEFTEYLYFDLLTLLRNIFHIKTVHSVADAPLAKILRAPDDNL